MADTFSRRSVLTGAAAVVVGGVAGFVVTRNSAAAKEKAGTTAANAYGAGSPAGTGQPTSLATVASIPGGSGRILQHPPVVLVRGSGRTSRQVHAFSAVCTHQGCVVSTIANGTIDCPCHGSKFDIQTGRVVAGPAPSPLPTIAVTVRAGKVYRS